MPRGIDLQNPKINNLVTRIAMGEVKIPPLQRPFVWDENQILELLESIYNDYPIGSILWWETSTSLPAERDIAGFKLPSKPESHPFYYVLDGQQRLSSLYGIFCTDRTLADATEEYKIDTNAFNIVFDCTDKKFLHESDKAAGHEYFELKSLFDSNAYANALIAASPTNRQVIQDLYEKFSNYEIPVVVTKKREIDEVGAIFERVNNTGTALDLFDLMVALTWTPEFHLQSSFKDIHKVLKKKNFDGIKNKILLQCLSVILKESCKTHVITSLKGSEVRDSIAKLTESLKLSVDYLSTQLKIGSGALLPHAHQIIPICYLFSRTTSPSVAQLKVVKKWFWKTAFSARYSAGTDKNVDEDIRAFKQLLDSNNVSCFDGINYSVTEEQLRNTVFAKSNPFSRAFVILLANKSPKDLTNGNLVDTASALSSFNRKEYHHVFPKDYLEGQKIDDDKINSLCNFCLLPADSNKKILNKAPSTYFTEMVPTESYNEIVSSNLLPINIDIYKKNDYSKFLSERAKKVIEFIDMQMV